MRRPAARATPTAQGRQDRDSGAPISAVSRAMDVLEHLALSPAGVAVSDLSRDLGVDKSVVSRILTSLAAQGYVQKDASSEHYHLTFKLSALAYTHFGSLGFPERIVPILRDLAQETGELVELAAVEGGDLWFIAKVEGWHRVRVAPYGGGPIALHATASGKIWLATLPEEEAQRLVGASTLRAFRPGTITSARQLMRELVSIRELGYATSVEEFMDGANSVAVPIWSPAAPRACPTAVGTLVVVGPTFRLTAAEMERLVPRLQSSAQALSYVWPLAAAPRGETNGG